MKKVFRSNKLKYWRGDSLRRLVSIFTAALDRRAPIAAKMVALFTVIYALSPIDFIPDFIPGLGLVDDAIIVPAGLWLLAQLMPDGLLQEHYERRAGKSIDTGKTPDRYR